MRRPTRSTRFPSTTLFRARAPEREARRARRAGGDVGADQERGRLARQHARLPRAPLAEVDVEVSEGRAGQARVLSGETPARSEEHTSELQSQSNLVCRPLL